MRRRGDRPLAESTKAGESRAVITNLDKFYRTRPIDEEAKTDKRSLGEWSQNQIDEMRKWTRLDDDDDDEQDGRDEQEMSDYKYLQHLARKSNRRHRGPVTTHNKRSHSSRWTIGVGGPASLIRRPRTKLSKRRFRVQSFIMRKLSTLSRILFMFICLALISASISTRQPWANCEEAGQEVGEKATNSSSSISKLEIQRSPRAASGVVDLLATQRRARQQTTRQQAQTTTTTVAAATNKVVDSAPFDIERKPQNNNNYNAAVARTSANYGERQEHDDLSSLSLVDLNLTNSIDSNSAANGASLSSLPPNGSIVVLDSGRPKYENYPIDPSAQFDSAAVQSPFAAAADDFLSAHGGQSAGDGTMDARTSDRRRAHKSADLSSEQQWQQTNMTTTTTTGGSTTKQKFLDASLEAHAKLKDTVQQLHYNKSLSFERTTAVVNNSSSTSGTLLSPHALVDATHESGGGGGSYQADQSNLLPSSVPLAGYHLAPVASDQLVSVSPTGAPSQLIEYANDLAQTRDPLETAASADEVRQRQHNDSRTPKSSMGSTDWGRRKSAVVAALTSIDNELVSETASDDQTRAAAPLSPYEDIVTWTPAAGPAAYRAGSGFQPAPTSQRADNLANGDESAQPASEQTNSAPNENFYAPASRYSLASTNLNATRRSDSDSDSPLVPIAPGAGAGSSSKSTASPSATKRRHQKPQTLAFKTRAPRVKSNGKTNTSLTPAYANREHFGSDEADSRQSARFSDLAGRERSQRPSASQNSPDTLVDQRLDRADLVDLDENQGQQPLPNAVKRKKSKRVKVKQQLQEIEPEQKRPVDEGEPEVDTQDQQPPLAASPKFEREPTGDQEVGQDQEEAEYEVPPRVSSNTTPRPAQVTSRKKATSRQQVAGANLKGATTHGRQWKQSSSKQSKYPKHADKGAYGQGDRVVQWSQLDVSGSSTVKASPAEGQPKRPPIIKTFRLAEPKFSSQPLVEGSPPPLKLDQPQEDQVRVVDSNVRANTNQALYVAPRAFSFGAAGAEPAQSQATHQRSDSARPAESFRPLLAPVSQFQAIQQIRRQPQSSASASPTDQLISQELAEQQQPQRQNWSVVVLPYPKPVENAQSYFGPLHLAQQQASQASVQQPFNAAAESAAQAYAAPAPPIAWPTPPANEIGQQLAVFRRQHELMQQQQQQMAANGVNKLIQRGTRDAPAEMRAPDNTLTINLSTRAASAIGPNQRFWEAAAREAAAQQQQHQQARSDAQKVPVSNGHTPPQHRESRQSSGSSLPMMRRPLAAMRHPHQYQNMAFGNDQAGSAPGGSVYPNDAYTNGHAYAGSTLKGPQLAAALDSLRSFNEFAHFQQASSNEFAFADPMANANHFYSFAGANPFETTMTQPSPQQQQQHHQQVAATDAFTSLLHQSGYGPAASFFPTNAQASAMAGGGGGGGGSGQTNNNSQFVKKGSAQLIASTPPMATPAGVRDPFGWPLAYGSQAAKSLLQINQVAPAPNYLIPSDKLKELAATSQQQQKSLRPTIENVQDLPSATSWNPNQAVAAAFPLWAAASAPAPVVLVRPSSTTSSSVGASDLAAAASSSSPQNVMHVQISTRAPSRRERFWKRLRLFRRSLGDSKRPHVVFNNSRSGASQDDELDASYLSEFDRQQPNEESKKIASIRHKRSLTARASLREQLVKSPPVVRLMESLRNNWRDPIKGTPSSSKKTPASQGSSSSHELGGAESQVHSQVLAPPVTKLAMIDQDESQTGHASSASGTRTAFIPLLDTSNLLDNLESDLLAQALLFSQRQHMQQRLATSGGHSATRAPPPPPPPNYQYNGQLQFQQPLESAPHAQFLLPAHSMQMVSHTPLYPNGPAPSNPGGKSVMTFESEDYNQLAGSASIHRPDVSQSYGMLMQAAASINAPDGQHLKPPVNEPGATLNTHKDQQVSGTGPRARIKQLSSQLMRQSRKPLTKLIQMTNFTNRFQPVSMLKSVVSPVQANTTSIQMATSASSVRPTIQKQQGPSQVRLPFKQPPPPGYFSESHLLNQPLIMSHYLGGGANNGLGWPYQEMLALMSQQMAVMQPSMTMGQHGQLLFPAAAAAVAPVSRPPTLQASMPFAVVGQQRPPQSVGTNFNPIHSRQPQDVNHTAPPRVGATVIAGNRTHSLGNPMAAASNEASHLVRFAEVPTSYNHYQQARLFAPANAPHHNQSPSSTSVSSQRAHERADEIGQLISGLKSIKQSLQEKSSELTGGGDALRRVSGHQQFQFMPATNTMHHQSHQLHATQAAASRRQQQVKVSPTLREFSHSQPAHHQPQQQFVRHQVSTSPSFQFVSEPPRTHPGNQRNNDEQATLMAAAAAGASQHEHDFSSYLSNFPQAANYTTDAEIFSSPSDQQPVELQASGAHELALANSGASDEEQQQQQQAGKMSLVEQQAQQQQQTMIDDPSSLLSGSSGLDEEQRQQQLINHQAQQQQPGGNFISQDEAQFQQQQQNAFLQMQQFAGSNNNVNLPRPRLPKFSIPSINSITNKFRQHLYQAFKLNPMGGGSSRWPTMLASPASYMSYQQQQQQQQPSGFMGTFPVQQQQQPQQPQQVNFIPAGVQLQHQHQHQHQQQQQVPQPAAFNMEPSASNYYDVTRQPPAHFQAHEFSMGPQQQRVQMVRPPVMQMHQQSQPIMNFGGVGPVNSNRMARQQQIMGQVQPMQQQQQMFVSSAPISITSQMPLMNNNNKQQSAMVIRQRPNSIMTDQYGNNLLNQTTEIGVGPYQQQVVGEQTISDSEIVGLDMTNGTHSIAQTLLMTGGNNLTMTNQQELFSNRTQSIQDEHQPNPLQGVLTELNGNLITSDESYIQEDQLDLANQQQSLHGGGKAGDQVIMQPDDDAHPQTRQPEESQQQENIAIKSQDQQQQQVVISGDPDQPGREPEMYDQQQHQVSNNTAHRASQQQQPHMTTMLEPSGGQQDQQRHYELERVVATSSPNSTSVRLAASSRLPRPGKGRPNFSRPGQRQKQAQQHREVDYQVIRASSDITTSQQQHQPAEQQQSYMEIVHLSNGTIDQHRQIRKSESPLFKHASTRPVHRQHHQNQLQRHSIMAGDAANETQSPDSHETTTTDRIIVPVEEHEIDPNSIEYHHQHLYQSQDDAEQEQQHQQPAQILHGTNQILAAGAQDQEHQYNGHSTMADDEVVQQLDNQLAGRPLNWRINMTNSIGRQNASLQYDFRPVELSESSSSSGIQQNSTGSLPAHEQFVLIDQPVILTGPQSAQASQQVEPGQHIQYSQVNQESQPQTMGTPKLNEFELNSNSSSSQLTGGEQPAVFVSIKPERVVQSTPQTSVSSPSSSKLASQQQNRKRPLKMPKRAPANLQLVQDQRASESAGTSSRANLPPGLIVTTNNATIGSSTTTTTSTTSRPTQARRINDTRNHNYKASSSPSSVSLKDSYTRAPKARIRWQGAHHSPAIGVGLNDTSTILAGNKTTASAADSANDNQAAAWIMNGMTHQAYSSPRPLNDSTQETSVTISQVPFSRSTSTSTSTVAPNHNYDGNQTQQRTAVANHKLEGQLVTPASESSTSQRMIPANHRAVSTEANGGESSKGRADSRTGSTSFKLSSGGGGGGGGSSAHSTLALESSAAPANLSTARPTTQPPRVNQLIDDSFLLASATESSQVALDQMLAAASGPTTTPNTTQVVSPDRADQPAIVRRSEPTGGEATSGNQTTLSIDRQRQLDQTTPQTAFDDAETYHAGDWARDFATAGSEEGEPRIRSLAAAAGGKLLPGEQLPLAVRIRIRQQQGHGQDPDQELGATGPRLLSQSNETEGMSLDDAHDELMMKHADR